MENYDPLLRKSASKLIEMFDRALLTEEELTELLSAKTYSPWRDTRVFISDPWNTIIEALDNGTITQNQYETILAAANIEHEDSFNIDFNRCRVGGTVRKPLPEQNSYKVGDLIRLHQNGETITGRARITGIDKSGGTFTAKIVRMEDSASI